MSNSHFASLRSRTAAALVAAGLLLFGSPALAAESPVRSAADEAGLGLAAGTCTALYVPFKAFVAVSGFMIGGAAWAVTGGEEQPALSILQRTGGGDWIVTQQHLKGQRHFYVLARTDEERVAEQRMAR